MQNRTKSSTCQSFVKIELALNGHGGCRKVSDESLRYSLTPWEFASFHNREDTNSGEEDTNRNPLVVGHLTTLVYLNADVLQKQE